MRKVTGLGGIFFKCEDPEKMKEWYKTHLGIESDTYGTSFEWRKSEHPQEKGFTVWSPFSSQTKYFEPSSKSFMINYRVENIEALVEALKSEGVQVLDDIETYEYGKFVHLLDAEGNKIELWEPNDAEYDKMGGARMPAPNWRPTHLENSLVRLVPLEASDFDRVFEAASDPLIWEQHPNSDRYKREVFQSYFDGAVQGNTAFVIEDRVTGQVVGCTRYYQYKSDSVAIGYTFLIRKVWGGAYNMACKKLLIDYAFQYVDKVIFHIAAQNIRSQKGTQKVGAVKVAEIDMDGDTHFEYMIQRGQHI